MPHTPSARRIRSSAITSHYRLPCRNHTRRLCLYATRFDHSSPENKRLGLLEPWQAYPSGCSGIGAIGAEIRWVGTAHESHIANVSQLRVPVEQVLSNGQPTQRMQNSTAVQSTLAPSDLGTGSAWLGESIGEEECAFGLSQTLDRDWNRHRTA